jgi:hypothetical protein
MEEKHTGSHKDLRSSSYLTTVANVTKMYVGISFISGSMPISQAGLYGSIFGFIYVITINMYTVWLMVKARNRFKNQRVVDIGDLSALLFGESTKGYMKGFLAANNTLFLSVYVLYFGTQIDNLMCESFQIMSCGNNKKWAIAVNFLLLPIIFI